MSNNHVLLEKKREIATITFNRPEKRNALTYDMWRSIPKLVKDVENDPAIKVLILRGIDHKSFAAGADISEFKTIRSNEEGARTYNVATREAEGSLKSLEIPTIAMVQGVCIGGGCQIATACDFRFSDSNGLFGITPARLGMVYSLESTKQLVDLVGISMAKYILLSGRHLDVMRAFEIGLVDEVFSPEEIEEKTYQFAQELCQRAQFSVRNMKYIISEIAKGAWEDTEETHRLRLESFATQDYKEGVKAFMEKRKPNF